MSKKFLILTILIVIAIIIIVGVVWAGQKSPQNQGNQQAQVKNQENQGNNDEVVDNSNNNANTQVVENGENGDKPEIITSEIDTSDWLTYRNEEYGFEFYFPKNIRVYDCAKNITGSVINLRMRYVLDDYDWCNAPGKAITHLIYVDLSQHNTLERINERITNIEKQDNSVIFDRQEVGTRKAITYSYNEKDDEGNILIPHKEMFTKQVYMPVKQGLYLEFSINYKVDEVTDELSNSYIIAFDDLVDSFSLLDSYIQ